MPTTTYSYEEYRDMEQIAEAYTIILRNITDKLRDKDDSSQNDGRFIFIHNGSQTRLLDIFRSVSKNFGRNDKIKFVDAGAGVGNVLKLAYIGFRNNHNLSIKGIEIDKRLEEYQKLLGTNRNIKWGDILKEDYKDYNVIYFYRPFSDSKLQRKFEKRVGETAKVGSYIIPFDCGDYYFANPKYFKREEGYFKKIKKVKKYKGSEEYCECGYKLSFGKDCEYCKKAREVKKCK